MITHTCKKLLMVCCLLLMVLEGYAQQFSVQRFRLLPNDISAYIQPERDLNDEACALLKVVANRDFVFSTPLGVVKRKNDVGEIWLYVPKGTVQITIKHPQWGVLRDYRLPCALESRLTYELVLSAPVTMPRRKMPRLKDELPDLKIRSVSPSQLPMQPTGKLRRPKELPSYLILFDVAGHKNDCAGGIRLGWMRRHGFYVHALSNFQKTSPTQGLTCNEQGKLMHDGTTPYYTGHTENAHYAFIAGGLHRIYRELCLYEGMGYGKRTVTWETNDHRYVENADYSYKGLTGEMGLLYRWQKWAVSVGVISLNGQYWEYNIGLGVRF